MSPQSPPSPDDRSLPAATSSSSSEPDEAIDFDQSLKELEQSLLLLKARYAQIQLDQQRQQDLQQRKAQIEKQLQYSTSPPTQLELKRELKQTRQRLEELELALESQLFSWNGMKQVFWQSVRFGGLGVVLGWVLKSLVG